MHPDFVHFSRRNPITGYVNRRKTAPVHFADAGRVVFVVGPDPGRGRLRITPVTSHFTVDGRNQWTNAPIERPVRYAETLDHARAVLAAWADEDDYDFERMRHTWHATQINPRALVSPIRLVDVSTTLCEAVRNNPNGHVLTIGDPHRPAYLNDGAVLATARRFSRTEGADFNGWIVEHGADYTDPLGSKRSATDYMKNLAYELV
ncbi:hypothetical protein ACWDTQ_22960 [Streptomyces cellulosae]|uniref:Uncharacterized protein n=1 Tax=Streptomyces cellulosae TaxID=1968 RepID=A0ABW6JJU5_STRCE